MQNVTMKTQGSKLVIEVDMSKELGPSKSGKTIMVATTGGNQRVGDVMVGVNVYRK